MKMNHYFDFKNTIAICEQEGFSFSKKELEWAKKLWQATSIKEEEKIKKELYKMIDKGEI